MEEYKCETCKKPFGRKWDYERHLARKKPCEYKKKYTIKPIKTIKTIKPIKTIDSTDYIDSLKISYEYYCDICEKGFNYKYNLTRHLKENRCRLRKNDIEKVVKTYIKENKEEIKKLTDGDSNVVNVINQNNQLNKNVNILKPGQERVDHITKDVILPLLFKKFTDLCKDLMTLVYFNKKVPENCNWCIIYPKNKKAGMIFNHDTEEFERKNNSTVIDEKFANMMNLLLPVMEEISNDKALMETLTDRQKRNLAVFFGHFGLQNISDESPEVYKVIHELAYNTKAIPMKSWKDKGLEAKHLSLKF